MKYIMLVDELGGHHPVMFHDHLTHSIVATGVVAAYRAQKQIMRVESAGWYNPETEVAHGRSESLDLNSLPEDGAYISIGGSISYIPRAMIERVMKGLKP